MKQRLMLVLNALLLFSTTLSAAVTQQLTSPWPDGREVRLNEKGNELMKRFATRGFKPSSKKGIARVKARAADGEEWSISMGMLDEPLTWSEMLTYNTGEPLHFEDKPFYFVYLHLEKIDENGQARQYFTIPLFWPCRSLYEKRDFSDLSFLTFDEFTAGNGVCPAKFELTGGWLNENSCSVAPYTVFNAYKDGEYYLEQDIFSSVTVEFVNTPEGVTANIDVTAQEPWSDFFDGDTHIRLSATDFPISESLKNGVELSSYGHISLIGDQTGWDHYNYQSDRILVRTSPTKAEYNGEFNVSTGRQSFRFYHFVTNDPASFSIGAGESGEDEDMEIEFDSDGIYSGPLVAGEAGSGIGMRNWCIPDFTGYRIAMTVNLDDSTVEFRSIQKPETFDIYLDGEVQGQLVKNSEGIYTGTLENFSGGSQFYFRNEEQVISAQHPYFHLPASGWMELNVIYGNELQPWEITVFDGRRIEFLLDLDSHKLIVRDPDVNFDPASVKIAFAADTPHTFTLGEEYRIVIEVDEATLGGDEVYMSTEGLDDFVLSEIESSAGTRVYLFRPDSRCEGLLQISTPSLDQIGIRYEHAVEVVNPDYVTGAEDKMWVISSRNGFDTDSREISLDKVEAGIYEGVVTLLNGEFINFLVPYESGETKTFGPKEAYEYEEIGDTGIECQTIYMEGRHYVTYELCRDDIGGNKRVWKSSAAGDYRITIDLNELNVIFAEADYKPYLTSQTTEIKAKVGKGYEFDISSNCNFELWHDGVVSFEMNDESMSQPGFDSWRRSDECIRMIIYFDEECSGTLVITPKEKGVEPLHIPFSAGNYKLEGIEVSSETIIVKKGEFVDFSAKTYPYPSGINCRISNPIIKLTDDVSRSGFLVLGLAEGETRLTFYNDEDDLHLEKTVNVTVLPKDAKAAEHVAYHQMLVGGSTQLLLSSHEDCAEPAPAWRSSNPEIVSVDNLGNVEALKPGIALLSSSCGDHVTVTGVHVVETTDVDMLRVRSVSVHTSGASVIVTGLEDGEVVSVYSDEGILVTRRKATGGMLRFEPGVTGVLMVHAAGETFKVIL